MTVPSLIQKLKLRDVEFPNRIVLSPMQMYAAQADGKMTDWHMVHYGKYAYAKFGTIFTEVLCVEKRGRSTYADAGIWSDSHIKKLQKFRLSFARKEVFQRLRLAIVVQNPPDKDHMMACNLLRI